MMRVTESYVDKFWDRASLSPAAQSEFFALPYHEAVSLVQRIASDNVDGLEIGLNLNQDIPISMPGHPVPKEQSLQFALRTKKLLVGRRMQAHMISHFGTLSVSDLMEQVEFRGLERLEDARRSGLNVCLINSHVGSGLLVPILLARMGYILSHLGAMDLAANFDLEGLDRIDQIVMRKTFGAQVLAAGLRGIQKHGMLHLAGDGLRGLSGTAQPFLGKLRRFPQGAAYVGVASGAVLMPVFTRLSAQGRLRMTFHTPLQALPASEPLARRMDYLVVQYAQLLEEFWSTDFGNVPAGFVRRHLALPDAPSEAHTVAQS